MAEIIGEITILHGKALAEGPDGVRPLSVGSPVHTGEMITTGGGGALEIKFIDGALLSQGPDATVALDEYVFDPEADTGEMTLNLVQGTFRSVTGQIVDMNPEGFQIDTPMATIGIRGTTTGHGIKPGGVEQHVVLDFDNKPVVVESIAGGPVSIITQDGMGLVARPSGLGPVRLAPLSFINNLGQLSTQALQQRPPTFQPVPDNGDEDPGRNDGDGGDDDGEGDGDGGDGDGGEGGEEGGEEGGGEGEGEGTQGGPGLVLAPDMMGDLGPALTPPAHLIPVQGPMHWQGPIVGNIHELPPVDIPDPDDVEDEIVHKFSQNLLDLSTKTSSMVVDLDDPDPYYMEQDKPETRTSVDPSIINVLGAQTATNDITGSSVANMLTGGNLDDQISGLCGNDTVFSSGGVDNLNGGDDFDYVSYYNEEHGVTVNLADGTATKHGMKVDTLTDFEGVYGSNEADNIFGNDQANALHGNGGDDVIAGKGGLDTLTGGEGDDVFVFDSTPVTLGTMISGDDGSDTLHFENTLDATNFHGVLGIEGIHFATTGIEVTLEARDFPELLLGNSLSLSVDSGGSQEFLTFNVTNTAGELVNLTKLAAGTNWEATDQVKVVGNIGNDSIYGSNLHDSISGGDGEDFIKGYGGNDVIHGGADKDILDGGDGDDIVWGDAGNDFIQGSAGNDVFKGNHGTDILSFAHLDSAEGHTGVNVNMGTNTVSNDGQGGSDSIYEFETIIGSDYADEITTTNAAASVISAGGGADKIIGKGKADVVSGGAGNDTFNITQSIISTELHGFDGGDDVDTLLVNGGVAGILARNMFLTDVENIEISDANTVIGMSANAVTGQTLNINIAESSNMLDLEANAGGGEADFSHLSLSGDGRFIFTGSMTNDTIRMGENLSAQTEIWGNASDDTSVDDDVLHYTDTTPTDSSELANVYRIENVVFGDATTKAAATSGLSLSTATLTVDARALTTGHTLDWDGSASNSKQHIYGGADNDSVVGSGQADMFFGGEGDDVYIVRGSISATSGHMFDGQGGSDKLLAEGYVEDIDAKFLSLNNVENIEVRDTDTSLLMSAEILSGQALNIHLSESTNMLKAYGTTGDDSLDFSNINLTGGGQFFIQGDEGNDTFNMGTKLTDQILIQGNVPDALVDGSDVLRYTDTTPMDGGELSGVREIENIIFGDAATKAAAHMNLCDSGTVLTVDARALTGSNALDWDGTNSNAYQHIFGTANDDIIIGGGEKDEIHARGGADVLFGGGEDDKFFFDGENVDTGSEIHGGNLNDRIVVESTTDFSQLSVMDSIEQLEIQAGATATFNIGAGHTDILDAIEGMDVVFGSGGGTVETLLLEGTENSDFIDFTATPNFDASWGSEDVVRIDGGGGGDQITTWDRATVIDGGTGDDILFGSNFVDTINGGADADDITGGGGDDILSGGLGNDTFVYDSASEFGDMMTTFGDTITDFSAGDKFDIQGNGAGIQIAQGVYNVDWFFVEGQLDPDGMNGTHEQGTFIFDDSEAGHHRLYYDMDGCMNDADVMCVADVGDAVLHATDIVITDPL